MKRPAWMPDLDQFSNEMWKQLNMSRAEFEDHLDRMNEREQKAPALGHEAPDFSLRRISREGGLTEERVRLSNLRGRPTALVFGSYT